MAVPGGQRYPGLKRYLKYTVAPCSQNNDHGQIPSKWMFWGKGGMKEVREHCIDYIPDIIHAISQRTKH